MACKKWHDCISEDYNFFRDIFCQKINYYTLSDLNIVKPQDIFKIIYFTNPQGICTILENTESYHSINYIYQYLLKIKNWVTSRYYSHYTWIIYRWKESRHHFLRYTSSWDPQDIILSWWVPIIEPYKDFINNDDNFNHRKMGKDPKHNKLMPCLISIKEEKLPMMPRSYHEEMFYCYDTICNKSPKAKDFCDCFFQL